MNKVNAVIIDDEASNRGLIKSLIMELNWRFNILGEAEGVNSGFELITTAAPDVVFLDIKMPDGTGFAMLDLFEKIDFEVVFITGFDSYALKAFEFNALDYILKPIDPEKFSKTLDKLKARVEKKGLDSEYLKSLLQSYDLNKLTISKIPIHSGNSVNLLAIEDVVFIKAESGYTLFKTSTNHKHISSKQLSDFDFILEKHPYLIKVHKAVYVNLNFVSSYSKGKLCFLTMKDGTSFEISRRKKGEILELLAGKKEEG